MKKGLLLITALLTIGAINLSAQVYNTDVPFHTPFDSSYVVGQGMTDSFTNGQQGFVTGQFVLCDNAVLKVQGNQSSSSPAYYLYPGATLILEDSYFYPTVYMKQGSTLDAKGGNQNIICYREIGTTLTDTANVNWLKDSVYTGMNFSYTNWPNASSPCAISPPQAVNELSIDEAAIYMQSNTLNYALSNSGEAELAIIDMNGAKLLNKKVKQYGQLNLSYLASGIYIVRLEQKGKLRIQKILID